MYHRADHVLACVRSASVALVAEFRIQLPSAHRLSASTPPRAAGVSRRQVDQ
jgi:hypothetical protein